MSQPAPDDWYRIDNVDEIDSPTLLVYPDRIDANIQAMIDIAGDPARLRPHVKTYKMAEVVRAQVQRGIDKFKCATIAEAEMTALAGGRDILLAHQPVGPKVGRLVQLARAFPDVQFSAVVDNLASAQALGAAFSGEDRPLGVYLDLDVGMHRTGAESGPRAVALYQQLAHVPGLKVVGLHAYDGHLHDPDPRARERACQQAFAPMHTMVEAILAAGMPAPIVVASGAPTLKIHARLHPQAQLSPGTTLLWDWSYGQQCADLPFRHAAVLLTRVISRPGTDLLCLDLGTKAVASEMAPPRVHLFALPDAQFVSHNEEHMTLRTSDAASFPVGTVLYGVPWHVCPTVNLQSDVAVVRQGRVAETWPVVARARRLTI